MPLATDKATARRLLVKMQSNHLEVQTGLRRPPEEEGADAVPLLEHLQAFANYLTDHHRTRRYVAQTVREVRETLVACRFTHPPDLDEKKAASTIDAYLANRRREEGLSISSTNSIVRSLKNFVNWLADHRTGRVVLKQLRGGNAETDPRRPRRILSDQELARLIEVTEQSPVTQWGLDGPARALCYRVAALTGFRAAELGRLEPQDFDLQTAVLTLGAWGTKNRKPARLPLHSSLLPLLRLHLAGLKEGSKVFPGTWAKYGHAAAMIRRDLESAGISYADAKGKRADFHSLRSSFCSSLARANVSVKVAMELTRHASADLFLKIYSKLRDGDTASAVASLPGLPASRPSE